MAIRMTAFGMRASPRLQRATVTGLETRDKKIAKKLQIPLNRGKIGV
jgi:hypothetical protein